MYINPILKQSEKPAAEGGEVAWLHKFINCTPFGADAPATDLEITRL